MSNDRINTVLALLAPHIVSVQEPLYFRSLLEDLHDGAQDDLMSDLRDTRDAAQAWGVSLRRAAAHITRLHTRYGIARQLGGAWVLRRQDIEAHRPDQRFRPPPRP